LLVSNQEEVTRLRGFAQPFFFVEHKSKITTKKKRAPRQKRLADGITAKKITETTVRDLLEKAITNAKNKMIDSEVDLTVAELCRLLQMLKEYEDEDTPAEIEVKWVDPEEPSKET